MNTQHRNILAAALLLASCSTVRAQNDPDARFRGARQADFPRIANVTCKPSGTKGSGIIAFDLAWDHSWRAAWEVSEEQHGGKGKLSVENWDAAWVFLKVRKPGDGGWSQGTLSTNRAHHAAPPGAALDVGLSNDGKRGAGVFIYRDAPGHGANDWKGVTLRWMHAADGVPDFDKVMPLNNKLTEWLNGADIVPDVGKALSSVNVLDLDGGSASGSDLESMLLGDDRVEIQVHAIGMVYVPEGPFWAGDGATNGVEGSEFWAVATNDWEWAPLGKSEDIVAGQFSAGDTAAPFRIESEKAMKIGGEAAGILNNRDAIGMYTLIDDFNIDATFMLPAEYPKGYGAFYCMRYELTQGQYVAFLNTGGQPGSQTFTPEENRFRDALIKPAEYQTPTPHVACNWLSWRDGAAYAAWAGLRPMTELEYEKACRGPLKPVPNECAWGTDRIAGMDPRSGGYRLDNPGKPHETVSWTGGSKPDAAQGNASWSGTAELMPAELKGPLRAGIFATPDSKRIGAGASYWGIMELSGNLTEVVVPVGSADGRRFEGTHGEGTSVLPASWHVEGEDARLGSRGGSWSSNVRSLRVSCRRSAAGAGAKRSSDSGCRCVRTAPK